MHRQFLVILLVSLFWLVVGGAVFLVTRCDIAHWRGGVVLECVATDPTRVWPLPVVQPWFEDPDLPGEIADCGLRIGQARGPAPT